MAIYMKVEGIDSDVSHEGHDKWIELTSCSYGHSRAISMMPGNMQNRESSNTSIMDVSVGIILEKGCADLMQWILKGRGGKKIEIDYVSTANNIYKQIILTNALPSSFQLGCGGNDRPVCQLSFDSTQVEWKHVKQSQEGTEVTTPTAVIYNVSKGTVS